MKWDVILTLVIGGFITYFVYKTSRIYSLVTGIATLLLAYYFLKR
mgnify:CR=1 FL=1